MADNKESIARTLWVALAVCLVCSIFVAGAAISLKSTQQENAQLDKQRSILRIAGLLNAEADGARVREVFSKNIIARVVDLENGKFSEAHNPQTFDALKAAKDPQLSDAISAAEDIASIRRRERFAVVYMVKNDEKLQTLILPVRGYGLWSTLHGFLALDADLKTVKGFGFYQHAETPGLGGEVDNPRWLQQWPGKQIFNTQGAVAVELVKGGVDTAQPSAVHQVDALAGATLTSRGVENLLHYWMGEHGYGVLLKNMAASGV